MSLASSGRVIPGQEQGDINKKPACAGMVSMWCDSIRTRVVLLLLLSAFVLSNGTLSHTNRAIDLCNTQQRGTCERFGLMNTATTRFTYTLGEDQAGIEKSRSTSLSVFDPRETGRCPYELSHYCCPDRSFAWLVSNRDHQR